MATEEYLTKSIASGKRYHELPDRFRQAVPEEDWKRRVKEYCIGRGFSWVASVASTACPEAEYYEDLLRFYRQQKRLFPYHLGEYVCRHLRLTPFQYYVNILYDSMKEDHPYDSIPNFTAADIVRIMGIGRNEYIATMVQAKSKKLMWRMNKGIVKDLLPQAPLNIQIEPWWLVHVVNLGESEYRQLDPTEATVCHIAARPGGARYSDLNGTAVRQLYQRGLVWLDVPVRPEDQLSIPPLEGFVSNKTTTAATAQDPLETLLYQIFVAASDHVTVAKLADILNVDVATLRVSISMACRLRFCRKLDTGSSAGAEDGGGMGSPNASMAAGALGALDLDAMLRSPEVGPIDSPKEGSFHGGELAGGGGAAGGTGIAFVVDAEVTGYLMMGALTPNCKKHSVTLFEGGRVYGAEVIAELIEELHASVEMSQGFEGEMKSLVDYARSLAVVLECVQACAGGRPIELLRKESLAGMPPPQAFRILSHSYGVVLPITSLAFPPLPLSNARPASPVNYGPLPAAQTPWLQLLLYTATGSGPLSLVLAAGQQLRRLPSQLHGATHVLLWPWDAAAVRVQNPPVVVEAPFLLHSLNEYLQRSALLDAATAALATDAVASSDGSGPGQLPGASAASGDSWNPFELAEPLPGGSERGSNLSSHQRSMPQRVVGFLPSGEAQQVQLPAGRSAALHNLGLGGSLGFVRLLQAASSAAAAGNGTQHWLPLMLRLGIPMQPSSLCQAVCESAAAADFLCAGAKQAHRGGQGVLAAALAALAAERGACSSAFAGGGQDDDLGPFVDRPVGTLLFDGSLLSCVQLGDAADGMPLLLA
ncbi:hypothetical protein D9Q98_005869 [Chlorella vulgaris]|uniref:Protein FAM91A1 n=1 Tax=Chlorella vulgaris TaxID=3077 RepID=A0A9D4TWM3_CHLVU|nr:hypothetical protein D9Q98_005869 [Chlorella vulgaris]